MANYNPPVCKLIILPGTRFGKMVTIREVDSVLSGKNKAIKRVFECRCDCGTVKNVRLEILRCGDTVTCGCGRVERAINMKLRHAMHGTPIYRAWKNMLSRVRGHRPVWKRRYTDRGITVCEKWLKFENFYADVGDKPNDSTLSLDRINNDGNYEPGNVRWATKKQQAQNRSL